MFNLNTKILVVDDFATMRKIAIKMLTDLGFTNVIDVVDGHQALATLRTAFSENSPYEIIISDWEMPNMSGLELFSHCRSLPELQKISFLMITAENNPQKLVTLKNTGVDFLVKPFTVQNLKNKLNNLHKKSASRAA